MKSIERTVVVCLLAVLFVIAQLWSTDALAQSSYFSGQGCSGCHAPPVAASCNGCHAHGTHGSSAKSSVNVTGTTSKSSYAPGETVTVTIAGGYRTGWIRAALFDQNMVELARSSGNDSGMGSSATYPAILSAPAPTTPGSYAWKVAWYGHQNDSGGAAFGAGWTPDATNPNHGYEVVNISAPFTVAQAAPPAPTISSVAPNGLAQGATNQSVTIAGTNFAGASVSFSNAGVSAGPATITANSITLPVSVAANAAIGAGSITITTAGGSIVSAFNVSAAATPAPTISAITPTSLSQGAVSQTITITGTYLTGATVSFSNSGITAGAISGNDSLISLPVSVADNAVTGTGTLRVATAGGSVAVPFMVSVAAIPAPAISSVTPGSLVQGAVNQTITIAGANLAGATVSFSNAGISGGTAVSDASSISVPVSVAANAVTGASVITVVTAGGSVSGTLSITPRASLPTLVVSALADGSYTNNATLNISGSVSAAAGVSNVTVNGLNAILMSDGSFSTAITLVAGVNTITVVASDNAGNQKSDVRIINYDPIAPVLTVAAPADNSTSVSAFVTVSGTVNETSIVSITGEGGSSMVAPMSGNNYSASINLIPGVNTITIVATDLAGNTSSAKRTIHYDTTKLTLSVTNPSQDMTTRRATMVLQGTVTNSSKEITVTITMNDKIYTHLVTNGIFKQRLTFNEAKMYPITVTAHDAAGNTATVTRNVIYRPGEKHSDDNGDDNGRENNDRVRPRTGN